MPNKEPYPKPKSGPAKRRNPRAVAPKPAKGPKMDRDLREKREMPKRIGKYNMAPREKREMPKQIMGTTKAQRADSAREMLDNMRSRNLLRSRNLSSKPKKRGM
jgi:hypothetical protein